MLTEVSRTEGQGTDREAARQRQASRAETTSYTPGELADGWEFKTIRSQLGLFVKRDFRERILAEEGRAGWVLVEKFDDYLMRLKRQRKLHPEPEVNDFDPYRTVIDGPERSRQAWSENLLALLAIVVVPVVIVFLVLVVSTAFR